MSHSDTQVEKHSSNALHALHAKLLDSGVFLYNEIQSCQAYMTHRRFFVAMILADAFRGKPMPYIASKFAVAGDVVQSLQLQASYSAGATSCFAGCLGWTGLAAILRELSAKLQFPTGSSQESLITKEFLELPSVQWRRAQALQEWGFQNISDLAAASITEIYDALGTLYRSEQASNTEDAAYLQIQSRRRLEIAASIGREAQKHWNSMLQDLLDEDIMVDREYHLASKATNIHEAAASPTVTSFDSEDSVSDDRRSSSDSSDEYDPAGKRESQAYLL
eukprot:Lankesteria_metandrocarpae@DN1517_c0_g1_i1.p1